MSEQAPKPPVIHVVDDDESLRTAVARLLRAAGYEVRCYASAGEFALVRSEDLRGCLLLDVRMPGPSGFDLQNAIVRGDEPLPIIFLTGHGDIPMSVRAMKSGAVDFLTKPVQRAKLLAAIKVAMERERTERTISEQRRNLRTRLHGLDAREKEIFARIVDGQPNKQIASEIMTSERTVKSDRARLMNKMGANTLADLLRIAAELRHLRAF